YNRFIAGMEGSPGDRIVYSGADNYHAPETPIINSLDNGRQAMYNGSVEGGTASGPYVNLKDSKSVGEGKKFTSTQKKNIIQQNIERNGGVIKSDLSGEILVPATQSKKGVTPNPLEAQIDHIDPRSKGGSNSYSNAQVLSREENIKKSNK
ncbi:MAG: HNH endonuclease, partial [Lachnospiraceae bacterium]|nr:HNH endonuclease [Lachnospiraceae bacterium]